MRRVAVCAGIVLLPALSCTHAGGQGRVGAAPPPSYARTVPSGFDPSVSGMNGAIGEVVYQNGGQAAWVKSGTNATDWQTFPGASSSTSQASLNIASLTPATHTAAVSIKPAARLLFVGDSLTKGYNGADNPLYRWQLYLEQWITSEFSSAGLTPPTIVATTAVSGQTSLDLLNGVAAQITSQTPDVTVVLIGTNDTVRTTQAGGGPALTQAQTQANITGIITAVLAANASGKMLFISPFFQTGENWPIGANVTNGGDAAMTGVRSAIQAAVAAAPSGCCQYIDASQYAFAWEATNNLAHASSGLLTQEGTHPTHPLGQQIWGAGVFQQLALATQRQLFTVIPQPASVRTITASSGQQALDFTNLAGGVDLGYSVEGEWQAGAAGDDDLILQINGVTTGYTTGYVGISSSTPIGNQTGDFGGGANAAGVAICRAGGTVGRNACAFNCRVSPTDGSSSNYRVACVANAYATATGASFEPFWTQAWVLSSGNPVNELKITTKSGNATKIGTSSWARVRREGSVEW